MPSVLLTRTVRRPHVHRLAGAARTVRTAVGTACLAALAGCVAALAPLPAPEPGLRRAAVEPHGSSCAGDRCTHTLAIGEHRVRVEERTRERTPDELRGRTAGTVARGMASSVAGAVLRRNGFATSRTTVGIGTRVVEDPAGALRMTCDVAWIDEVEHERVGGEDRSSTLRLAEGWRCDAATRADTSVVRWTLRGGIAPDVDSVATVVALLERGEVGTATLDAPLTLRRVGGGGAAGDYAADYTIVRAEGDGTRTGVLDLRAERWIVRRADGALVGVVHHSALPRTALDVADDATADERELMRLLAATVAQPLR